MATPDEIVAALREFVQRAVVVNAEGQALVDPNGRPVVLDVVEAVRALDELDEGPVGGHGCAHPEGDRRAAAVMGAPRQFYCLACDRLVNPDPQGV